MMKKIISAALACALALGLQSAAFAAGGFHDAGGYTDTEPAYYINGDEAVLVYNKNADFDPDYTEVWTGSDLYIPIYIDDDGNESHATAKKIKDDNVQVQWKALIGERYVDNVSIVDGKKDKIKNMKSGSYIKVEFGDNYAGTSYTTVHLVFTLSVNRVSYQESRLEFECDFSNRLEYISDPSVYGAQVPTRFKVESWYGGEATFDMGEGIKYTARVKRSSRYTIDFSKEPDYNLTQMYPKTHLQFYNFRGNNDTFGSVGELVLPVDTKKFKDPTSKTPRVYAYEILDNGSLRAIDYSRGSYDARNQELTIKTQSLGHYVLSNQALKQTVEEGVDGTFQYGYALDATTDASSASSGS